MTDDDDIVALGHLVDAVDRLGRRDLSATLQKLIDRCRADGPGHRTMRTRAGIAARDEWLRIGAREFDMAAPELAGDVADFQARIWPRERHLEVCPERHRQTIRWHIWHALRCWPYAPKERRLRDIIGGNQHPDFIAAEPCNTASEKEIANVPTDKRLKRRGAGS